MEGSNLLSVSKEDGDGIIFRGHIGIKTAKYGSTRVNIKQCYLTNREANKEVVNRSEKRGVLMISERSGFESWPGTLRCFLGQGTLLSQWLSPPRCTTGYQ